MSHVVPVSRYLLIFVALLVLLVATVAAAQFPLGRWSPVIAMTIAVAKAALILLYFMHLRYSGSLMRIVALSGGAWLLLLFSLLLSDYLTREGVERATAPAGQTLHSTVPVRPLSAV